MDQKVEVLLDINVIKLSYYFKDFKIEYFLKSKHKTRKIIFLSFA